MSPNENSSSVSNESSSQGLAPSVQKSAHDRLASRGTSSQGNSSSHQNTSITTNTATKEKRNELDVNISQLGLYGRQTEMQTIRKCLDDLMTTGNNQLLYISGISGTGKTALAASIADVVSDKNGIFAMGKFDQKLRDEPYAGIASAGRHICGEILLHRDQGEARFQELTNKIVENVGAELSVLAMILPEIEEVVGSSRMTSTEENVEGAYDANKERLNSAFRTFFRTVTSFFNPLVMVLDDIQWADLPSINLMEVLMTDYESSNFMLVALYRSNEVDETHFVTKLIKTLDEKEKALDYVSTKIEIGDLKVDQINEILMDLLKLEGFRTWDLAEVVHRRTDGNAFFVLNFIKMLKEQRLIAYSKSESAWVWDENQIELETIATDNVVVLLKASMKGLSPKMQEMLQLAACLGAGFKEDVLARVIRGYATSNQEDPPSTSQVGKWLTEAVVKGFFKIDSTGYRWIHDKIQEAALSIGCEEELDSMRSKVGKMLLHRLSGFELSQSLFVVVNLLNVGADKVSSAEEAMTLANLNMQAAEKAMKLSGFETGANYATRGIKLLPTDAWKSHYETTMKLHAIVTSAHGVLGNRDKMQVFYDKVMQQEDIPLFDRIPLYHARMESLSGHDVEAAKAIGYQTLKDLGHPVLPQQQGIRYAIAKRLGLAKDFDRNLNPDAVQYLPDMTDRNAREAIKMLSRMSPLTYVSNKQQCYDVTSKMLTMDKEFGVTDDSTIAYANRGSIIEDLRIASRYGKYALEIMKRSTNKYAKASSTFYVFVLILARTTKLEYARQKVYQNYHFSLQVGDIQIGMWCYVNVLFYDLLVGRPLDAAEGEAREHIRRIKLMNRAWQVEIMCYMWQPMLNMMGQTDDPSLLKGEAMDETVVDFAKIPPMNLGHLLIAKAFTNVFSGNHEGNVNEILDQVPLVRRECAGLGYVMFIEYYIGLSCLHCARTSGPHSNGLRRQGRAFSRKIKQWVAQGSPNMGHLDMILDAELAVLKKDDLHARHFYMRAMETAEEMGRIHDAGLAAERLGEYLMKAGDKFGARHALGRAVDYYRIWESDYKVESIRSKHSALLRPGSIVQDE